MFVSLGEFVYLFCVNVCSPCSRTFFFALDIENLISFAFALVNRAVDDWRLYWVFDLIEGGGLIELLFSTNHFRGRFLLADSKSRCFSN